MDQTNELEKKNGLGTGLGTLQRPRFSPGLLLEDEDLNAGVNYTRDLTRLLFKSLFGCGVICGLDVEAWRTCHGSKIEITVRKGIALDCLGNPLEVPSAQTFEYDPECKQYPPAIWVAVCYVERCCRPRDTACAPHDDTAPQPTRILAGFDIKLYKALPKCACHCRTKGDDAATKSHPDGCCQDATPDPQTAQTQGDEDPCACYSGHFKGECDCDCNSSCVLLGKILPGEPQKDEKGNVIREDERVMLTVEDEMVRRIRPVLNGYLECRFLKKPAEGTSTDGNQTSDPGDGQIT